MPKNLPSIHDTHHSSVPGSYDSEAQNSVTAKAAEGGGLDGCIVQSDVGFRIEADHGLG